MNAMKTLQFGIEIETVGLHQSGLARAIYSVVGGSISDGYRGTDIADRRGRTWQVVPDGSLSGGDDSGEIVSPVLCYEDIEELQNIIRAVRKSGARVDASCGIHYARAVVMRNRNTNTPTSWTSVLVYCA